MALACPQGTFPLRLDDGRATNSSAVLLPSAHPQQMPVSPLRVGAQLCSPAGPVGRQRPMLSPQAVATRLPRRAATLRLCRPSRRP